MGHKDRKMWNCGDRGRGWGRGGNDDDDHDGRNQQMVVGVKQELTQCK